MATVIYTATLNTYGDTYWLNNSRATQGCYDDTRYTGIMHFPQMNLKGKVINSVSLTAVSAKAGASATKILRIYRSSVQGIDTTLIGSAHRTGNSIGSISGAFYNNTLTVSADLLKDYIANGENTFIIYVADSRYANTYSENYLIFDSVTITVDYSESIVTPTAPITITPTHGTLTYYNTVKPTISWSGATNAVKYIVERATSTDIHLDNWVAIAETALQTFTDDSLGLSQGSYVRYRVKSISSTGTASAYRTSGNIRRMLPVVAPSDVVATLNDDVVALSWNADTAPFATFFIQYSSDGGENWNEVTSTAETSCAIQTLDIVSGPVIFRVRCDQNSVDSDEVLASPYGVSNSITIPGGLWLKVLECVVRGKPFIKTSGDYEKSRKVFAKADNEWRSSK